MLEDQIPCLDVPVRDVNIVMTLFASSPTLYEYLINVLKTLPMIFFMIVYMTTRLLDDLSKYKKKEPQFEDVPIVLQLNKGSNFFSRQGVKLCIYCWKLGYIVYIFSIKQRT